MSDLTAFEAALDVVLADHARTTIAELTRRLAEAEVVAGNLADRVMVAEAKHAESERVIARMTDVHDAILAIRDQKIRALEQEVKVGEWTLEKAVAQLEAQRELTVLEAASATKAERQRDALVEVLVTCRMVMGRVPLHALSAHGAEEFERAYSDVDAAIGEVFR